MIQLSHIYWFSYFNAEEPSVRYRAKYPLQQLKDQYGISFTLVYPGYDLRSIWVFVWSFFSVLFLRKQNSLIVYQKIYSNGIYANALKILLLIHPKNTMYDIDDAEHTRRDPATIHHFMKRCSVCSVGSRSLLDYTLRFNPRVFLLTSPVIDHGLHNTNTSSAQRAIGWIGYYAAHRESLTQLFFPALHRLPFPICLNLLGVETREEEQEIKSIFADFPHISLEIPLALNWQQEESIYKLIANFWVGVSPLLDTEFNRGKSAFKLKQCLSCAVPVLGSKVGENAHFLKEGINGFFCETPDQFSKKIIELHHSTDEQWAVMKENARQSHVNFSLDLFCGTLLQHVSGRR